MLWKQLSGCNRIIALAKNQDGQKYQSINRKPQKISWNIHKFAFREDEARQNDSKI